MSKIHGKDLSQKPVNMTHQHFRFIAEVIRETRSYGLPAEREAARRMMYTFSRELKRTNPRFDSTRFIDACGGYLTEEN